MKITYTQIRDAMKDKPYTMNLVGNDAVLVRAVVNQGIDSHLEACFCPVFGDRYDVQTKAIRGPCLDCSVSVESLPVLLRRLMETGNEDAECLVGDILGTLDINVESCCYEIVSPADEVVNENSA
jgi:hypothetical protein